MSELKARIQDTLKTAMRARDQKKTGVLRLLTAAIKQREVDERIELDDDQIINVLEKMLKQRRDSLEQYEKAGRVDLAEQEAYEIEILRAFMPIPLSEDELDTLIMQAIADSGAASIKDLGKVMTLLKPKVQGRADMRTLSGTIRARLDG